MADELATVEIAPVVVKERTSAQIADDLAPLTAEQQADASQLKVALFESLSGGKLLAPAPEVYTEEIREQVHDAFVLLTLRLEHVEDQLRHFTNAIQPRPDEPLPVDEATKPGPLDNRTARMAELLAKGMTTDEAVAQLEKEGL